ncbi:MAG: peptide chain release factor 2 [Bdellovibrionales bacterium]|nr:peptide chain release factor 2 [Bdellovibrionales bacterium]
MIKIQKRLGGLFDLDKKQNKLNKIEKDLQNKEVWEDYKKSQNLNQEKILLQKSLKQWKDFDYKFLSIKDLLDCIEKDQKNGESLLTDVTKELTSIKNLLSTLHTQYFLSQKYDDCNCYVSIHAGAGGTESCDWAAMLSRMLMRYSKKNQFSTEILNTNDGDEAGFKSIHFLVKGKNAFGLLQSESGVHRLVRISPFDSGARRHTSFASVFISPELKDSEDVNIKTDDIRVDTYRASGAGGQHVNTTDSAVRITHLPTNTVVQCQNQRSQHANKDQAMKMLKSALYKFAEQKKKKEQDMISETKKSNQWGSQIRSYTLCPYQLVKDHRTGEESGQPDLVLDGDLDKFSGAFLKYRSEKKNGE